MKEMNKTERIERALEGAHKVVPPKHVIQRMEDFALAYAKKVNSFSRETLMGMAASFLILLAVNIYAVNVYQSNNSSEIQTESEDYNLMPTKSIYR